MLKAALYLNKVVDLGCIETASVVVFHSTVVVLHITLVLPIKLHLVLINCRFR